MTGDVYAEGTPVPDEPAEILWGELTDEVMGKIQHPEDTPRLFYGFDLDRDFVEPLWTNAVMAVELLQEDESFSISDETAQRWAIVRVVKAISILLHGPKEEDGSG
jgi:hypothetical protein